MRKPNTDNLLRKKLEAGEPTVSTRFWSTNPLIAETIGACGNFDYAEFAAEYAAFSQIDLENICRAAELYDLATIIKVDLQNRGYVAQKAIAAGFQGVLFADHTTPEEVEESVRLTMPYTPGGGIFGFPMRRFIGGQTHVNQDFHINRVKNTVRLFMIEKQGALDAIDEICSIPGVDMVQFGSGDWSMSLGFNRADDPERCKAAERKMIEAALKHGVRPRCEVTSPEAAQYYKDLGVKDFALNDEMAALRTFWQQQGKKLRDLALS